MNDNAHIQDNELHAFRSNTMAPEERMTFLEHIGSCTFCSDRFAVFMSEDIITAPRDLKQNILKAVRHEQLIKDKVREASKRMQLFIYGLKVGAAASLALLMLFLTVSLSEKGILNSNFSANELEKEPQEKKAPITYMIRDSMDTLCHNIIDFSDSLIK